MTLRFVMKNISISKNTLRTLKPESHEKKRTTEAQPKFTGSYKKKSVYFLIILCYEELLQQNLFQGQTVVGDGTTSQFTAILVGDLERNLSEARKGMENSASVDRWPFIFKEYNKKG